MTNMMLVVFLSLDGNNNLGQQESAISVAYHWQNASQKLVRVLSEIICSTAGDLVFIILRFTCL